MKQFIYVLIIVFLFIFISLNSFQDVFAQEKFPLKKVKDQGFDVYQGILAWTPVSKDVNVGFARNYFPSTREYSLLGFTFSNHGKCQSPIFAAIDKGYPCAADLVWFNGENQTQALHNAFGGLVFVLFSTDIYYAGKEVTLAVAQFEENGTLTSKWTELMSIKAHSPIDHLYEKSLEVSFNDDCVGVALCVTLAGNYTFYRSFPFFLRTDFQGNLLGDPVKLKLTSKDKHQVTKVFRPAWNGTRWLVPVANSHFNDPNLKGLPSQVYVYASKDETARKFKARRIAQSEEYYKPYDCLSLIPTSPATLETNSTMQSDSKDYQMFVKHSRIERPKRSGPFNIISDYHLYTVNAQGRSSGWPIEILIPDQGFTNSFNNYISNVIPSYLLSQGTENGQRENDFLFAVQVATISPSPKLRRFFFHKIYPSDGSVATIAEKETNWGSKQLMPPSIRWNGKSILVLTQMREDSPDRKVFDYISSFKD